MSVIPDEPFITNEATVTFTGGQSAAAIASYPSPNQLYYSDDISEITAPRALAVINGKQTKINGFNIDRYAHGASDTATVTLPMQGQRDWSVDIGTSLSDPTGGSIVCEIYAGFPSNTGNPDIAQLSRRFIGSMDVMNPKFEEDSVTFNIRSLASLLLSRRITTLAQNYTSIQFLNTVAASLGLNANPVLRAGQIPTTLAAVYAHDFVVGIKNEQIFDILVKCAEVDDVQLWVDGDTINYVEPGSVQRNTIVFPYGEQLLTCEGWHSPQYSRNIKVEVRTYNPKTTFSAYSRITTDEDGNGTKTSGSTYVTRNPVFGTGSNTSSTVSQSSSGNITTAFRATKTTGGAFSTGLSTIPRETSNQEYIYYIPNLTLDQCNARRDAYWRQLSMYEYKIKFSTAPNPQNLNYFNVTTFFDIGGLQYNKFNDMYWPQHINEKFDISQGESGESTGWLMEVEGVNHRLAAAQV